MFIHECRLETLLKPDHYRSEAQYRREIEEDKFTPEDEKTLDELGI